MESNWVLSSTKDLCQGMGKEQQQGSQQQGCGCELEQNANKCNDGWMGEHFKATQKAKLKRYHGSTNVSCPFST
jgi:hypothetical protein